LRRTPFAGNSTSDPAYRPGVLPFRRAYDALLAATPTKADREYLRLLHLAARTTGAEVDQAIVRLMEDGRMPTLEAVRELVTSPAPTPVPKISKAAINLSDYNALIPSWSSHA
jgi:hypothetical protein